MAPLKNSRPNVYRVSGPTSTEVLQFSERLEHVLRDWKGQKQQQARLLGLQSSLDRTLHSNSGHPSPGTGPLDSVGNNPGSGGESRPHKPKGTAVNARLQSDDHAERN